MSALVGVGVAPPFRRVKPGAGAPAPAPAPAFDISTLFASSEKGVWWKPQDTASLSQTSVNLTAVNASTHPVGLIKDKSRGGALGTNQVTNGTFDTDTAGWASGPVTTANLSVVAGALRVSSTAAYANAYWPITVVRARRYRFSGKMRSVNGVDFAGSFISSHPNGDGAGSLISGTYSNTNSTTWVPFSVEFTAFVNGSWTVSLGGAADSASAVTEYDDIKLEEVLGLHLLAKNDSWARGSYNVTNGVHSIALDGVDDEYAIPYSGGPNIGLTASMEFFGAIYRTDNDPVIVADGWIGTEHNYFGHINPNNSTSGSASYNSGFPSYWVNGVLVGDFTTSAAALHAALPLNTWNVLEIRPVEMNLWTEILLYLYNLNFLGGRFGETVIRQAMTATQRNNLRTAIGASCGLTL